MPERLEIPCFQPSPAVANSQNTKRIRGLKNGVKILQRPRVNPGIGIVEFSPGRRILFFPVLLKTTIAVLFLEIVKSQPADFKI